jgi:transposase-like protein
MSKSTISACELFQMFPDADSARAYLEAQRWPNGLVCPVCDETKRIYAKRGGFYRCNACLAEFTVRTGTIFEKSKVPLNKWLYAMHLFAATNLSSVHLANEIGVTQKTAWRMIKRMREGPMPV